MSETKDFPTAAVLSIITGRLLGDFGEMHETIEWVAGHPVWTHELVTIGRRLTAAVISQHPELSGIDADLSEENYEDWTARQVSKFGDTLTLIRGSGKRTEHPIESLKKMIGDKPIIQVNT